MKRLSVWWVLTLLCTFSIFAQNKVITVSGRVVESDSKEPAAQATIQLLSLPDSGGIFVEGFLHRFPYEIRSCTIIQQCD